MSHSCSHHSLMHQTENQHLIMVLCRLLNIKQESEKKKKITKVHSLFTHTRTMQRKWPYNKPVQSLKMFSLSWIKVWRAKDMVSHKLFEEVMDWKTRGHELKLKLREDSALREFMKNVLGQRVISVWNNKQLETKNTALKSDCCYSHGWI